MNAYQPLLDFAAKTGDKDARAAILHSQRRLLAIRDRGARLVAVALLAVMVVVIVELAMATAASFGLIATVALGSGDRTHLLALLVAALAVVSIGFLAWSSHRESLVAEGSRLFDLLRVESEPRKSDG